ncbi:HGGxSTG domain-containing protein [Legionella parisiensis]|uniref:Uncharacterized protein n=1 Tax=Legionella parisiensis TaxID=45071 RepID=A0A1E5JUG5_9GAMM|nr:HGGxSTG domain-containing protein [Legionella parisiensis]KTD41847.1 hypothetical protein Lpar_3164 [Legionella parisiensis]OEH48120.1 hypothetical protein lpari_00868 [Legionella parisiensis]STX75826.1 Uncharacterised protein [Legionella parisiensis]
MVAIYLDKYFNVCISIWANDPRLPRKKRGACGSKTRKNTHCQAPPVWDKTKDRPANGRCKLHGGLSTGPRTEAGKQMIKESNHRRKKVISS